MPSYPESEYCTFLYADGRRCRTLKMPTRDVCLSHYRHDGQFNEDEVAVAELLTRSRSLDTPRNVSRALACLFRLTVQGKLPPRRTSQLAYIGHLILYGLSNDRKASQRAAQHEQLTEAPALAVGVAEHSVPASLAAATQNEDSVATLDDLPPLPVGAIPGGANGNGSHS